MERLNKNSLRFPAKLFTFAFATLGLMLTLVSCGNKGGNDYVAPVVPPIYGNGCTNCAGVITSPVTLATFTSRASTGYFSLENMVVTGQNNGTVPSASGKMHVGYAGPVATQGQLVVTQTIQDYAPGAVSPSSSCVISAGTYSIQSQTVGQMADSVNKAGSDITFPSLVTTSGGIEIKIEAPLVGYGMGFSPDGRQLHAMVSIVRVNGVICSQYFADTIF